MLSLLRLPPEELLGLGNDGSVGLAEFHFSPLAALSIAASHSAPDHLDLRAIVRTNLVNQPDGRAQ